MGQIKINQTVSYELMAMQNRFKELNITKVSKFILAETNLKKAKSCLDEHKQISDVIWSLKLAGLADVKDAMNQIRDAGDIDESLAKAIKTKGTQAVHVTDRQKEAKRREQVERMKQNRT